MVLLHHGIADSRTWSAVLDLLEQDRSTGPARPGLDLVAIDRRGFGESPDVALGTDRTHLADLVDVLDVLRC